MRDHLPRHVLEKVVTDDPLVPVHPAARVHIASCDRCSMRKRALEAARTAHLHAYPALDFARVVSALAAQPETIPAARSHRWFLLTLAACLLALSGFGLWWFARGAQAPAHASRVEARGVVSFDVLVNHRGATSSLRDGVELTGADRLTFSYAIDRPGQLLVLGMRDTGTITRYFPSDGASSAVLPPGPHAPLPIPTSRAPRSQERLFALFSATALNEAEVRAQLLRARSEAPGRNIANMGPLDLPAQQQSVWFRRR